MKGQVRRWLSVNKNSLYSNPISGAPIIEIVDNKRVLIEHHQGITSYDHEKIEIKVSAGAIEISGEKLEILSMSKERIAVCGRICVVNLRRKGNS